MVPPLTKFVKVYATDIFPVKQKGRSNVAGSFNLPAFNTHSRTGGLALLFLIKKGLEVGNHFRRLSKLGLLSATVSVARADRDSSECRAGLSGCGSA